MCRNHSHLIGDFTGVEYLAGLDVLMWELKDPILTIESSTTPGSKLILPCGGKLLVPSHLLAGSLHSQQLAMEGAPTYLCLLPADATIIMPIPESARTHSSAHFVIMSNDGELSPMSANGQMGTEVSLLFPAPPVFDEQETEDVQLDQILAWLEGKIKAEL